MINLERMIKESGIHSPEKIAIYANGLLYATLVELQGTFYTLRGQFNRQRPFDVFGGKYAKKDSRRRLELRGFADGLVENAEYGLAYEIYEFLGMKDKVKRTAQLAKQLEARTKVSMK